MSPAKGIDAPISCRDVQTVETLCVRGKNPRGVRSDSVRQGWHAQVRLICGNDMTGEWQLSHASYSSGPARVDIRETARKNDKRTRQVHPRHNPSLTETFDNEHSDLRVRLQCKFEESVSCKSTDDRRRLRVGQR